MSAFVFHGVEIQEFHWHLYQPVKKKHLQVVLKAVKMCLTFSLCLRLPAEANEEIVKVTYGELRRDVALFAAAMRKMGVQTGDRVVGESLIYFSPSHKGKTRKYGGKKLLTFLLSSR